MPLADYLTGIAYLSVTAGSVTAAAGLVVLRRLGHLRGVAAVLAFAILTTTGLLGVHLIPGLAGVLARESAALCAVVTLAAAAAFTHGMPTRRPPLPDWRCSRLGPALRGPGGASILVAALGAAVVAVWSITAAWVGTASPSTDIDTLTFHLPNVATWIQTGSVWRTDQFTPLLANGNYPQGGDVVMLTAVLPFENDAFVRAVGLPFAGVAALAVYALAVEVGARRTSAVAFAAAYAAVPVFVLAAYEGAKTDSIMLANFGAGAYFLVLWLRERRRSSLVLAGLGLGIALGTKWYGLWSAAIVVAVWAGAWLAARRPWRVLAPAVFQVCGLVALTGGVWMLRNAVESGSPIYPSPVRAFGVTIFDAPTDFVRACGGFTIAGYFSDPGVLRDAVLPAYGSGFRAPGALLAGGWAASAALVAVRLRGGPRAELLGPAALVAMAPLLFLAYTVTPYSAIGAAGEPAAQINLRWVLPALAPAAAVGAWAISQMGPRRRLAAEALAALAVIVAIGDGIALSARSVAGATAALLGLAIVLAVALTLARGPGTARRGATVALGLLLAAGLVALGDVRQQQFNRDRYAADPVIGLLASGAAQAERVGLAGVWTVDGISPVLPAFGPRLGREVEFVGYTTRGQLREYETRRAFLGAVRRGGYDLLVVGRATAVYQGCRVPGSETDEDAWARRAGFPLIAQTDRLSLYDVGDPDSIR